MTTQFVTSTPTPVQTQTTQLARLDPDAVTRQTLQSNADALRGYLSSIGPSMPAHNNVVVDATPTGVASPHEADGRTRRYKWTLIAVVCLAVVATGGLSFVAYVAGVLPNVQMTVAIWIGGAGIAAIYLTQWLQRVDLAYSPEAIALVRANADAYQTEAHADAMKAVGDAYAYTLRTQADADADARRAATSQRDAQLALDLARLQTTQNRHRSAPPTCADTCDLPAAELPPTCVTPEDACPSPAQPVSVAAVVLAWMQAGLQSGDIQPGRPLRTRAPWSDRADAIPPHLRSEVLHRLMTCDPPMVTPGRGGLYTWGPYSGPAARATVRGVLSDL